MKQRHFQPVTEYDQKILHTVMEALQQRKNPDGTFLWIPDRKIPRECRADNRLLDYGYTLYRELFNPRQLLHLSYLAEAIDRIEEPIRQAVALAFSDHLTTNCVMTHYAFGWRRLAPLFSVRAYRHVTRPVEINPWLDGTGRGTFPNAVRQIQRAIEWVHMPREALVQGGFCKTPYLVPSGETDASSHSRIIQSNSQRLGFLEDDSFDLVLSDPPYFDNIAYSELSDFFLPWLQLLRVIPQDEGGDVGFAENLAARRRDEDAMEHFQCALGQCFSEIARVLKPQGRFVFTYQHKTAIAWHALASALAQTGLRPIQIFPLLGDGSTGLHKHEGNTTWDAVFVFAKDERRREELPVPLMLTASSQRAATEHYKFWAQRLIGQTANAFRKADQRNFYSACLVAGALGLFGPTLPTEKHRPLRALLDEVQRESTILHESHHIQDGL